MEVAHVTIRYKNAKGNNQNNLSCKKLADFKDNQIKSLQYRYT